MERANVRVSIPNVCVSCRWFVEYPLKTLGVWILCSNQRKPSPPHFSEPPRHDPLSRVIHDKRIKKSYVSGGYQGYSYMARILYKVWVWRYVTVCLYERMHDTFLQQNGMFDLKGLTSKGIRQTVWFHVKRCLSIVCGCTGLLSFIFRF